MTRRRLSVALVVSVLLGTSWADAGACRHWNRGFFEATESSNRVFEKVQDHDIRWPSR
jgi:hypothetical protein